jgi:hypothetical protein
VDSGGFGHSPTCTIPGRRRWPLASGTVIRRFSQTVALVHENASRFQHGWLSPRHPLFCEGQSPLDDTFSAGCRRHCKRPSGRAATTYETRNIPNNFETVLPPRTRVTPCAGSARCVSDSKRETNMKLSRRSASSVRLLIGSVIGALAATLLLRPGLGSASPSCPESRWVETATRQRQ